MRRAAKIDRNHAAVVLALRRAGCECLSLAAIGNGCPDVLVARAGALYLLEIKDGDKSASRRRLTPLQREFHAWWPVAIVTNENEALAAVGLTEKGPR